MELIEPRPTVQAVQAASALPFLIEWRRFKGLAPADNADLVTALALLFEHETDAYVLARYVEREWNWPADQSLVIILANAAQSGRDLHDIAVKEWVLRTGVRFPRKPREAVLFRDADGELTHGIVQNVLNGTAEAIVAVVTDLDERSTTTPMIKLRAEEVVERAAV